MYVCLFILLPYMVNKDEYKLSLKGVWLWSRDPFKFSVLPKIFLEWLKLQTSNFVQWFAM